MRPRADTAPNIRLSPWIIAKVPKSAWLHPFDDFFQGTLLMLRCCAWKRAFNSSRTHFDLRLTPPVGQYRFPSFWLILAPYIFYIGLSFREKPTLLTFLFFGLVSSDPVSSFSLSSLSLGFISVSVELFSVTTLTFLPSPFLLLSPSTAKMSSSFHETLVGNPTIPKSMMTPRETVNSISRRIHGWSWQAVRTWDLLDYLNVKVDGDFCLLVVPYWNGYGGGIRYPV